jgi:tetratricopeptide (TPR) repeat protein
MSANRLKWMIFFIVFFFVSAIYFKTTAPTTAFWDVGEFLAASHILGVPHPPGTPFYVLLAKFFDLLPIPVAELYSLINGGIKANPVVLKMTLIPILMGGLNAALVYLISYEVLKLIKGDEVLPDWALHLFSATGALTMAFARIIWFDSLEVETYTPGAFFGILALYFGLLWYKNRENDNSLKWLILAVYSIMLGTGIHLTVLFALPALFFFVWAVKPQILWDKIALGLFGALFSLFFLMFITYDGSMVLPFVLSFLLMFAYMLVDRKFEKLQDPLTLLFILGALLAVFGLIQKNNTYLALGTFLSVASMFISGRMWQDWKGWVFIAILVGFSVEFWIIARAYYLHFNPLDARINEGDPYTWQAFMDVLLRKQYEPANILPRRIDLVDQIKVFLMWFGWQFNASTYNVMDPEKIARMTLFDHIGPFGMIAIALGILGMWEHFVRDRRTFTLVGLAVLLAGVGFFIAFNFKDSPSHPVNPINAQLGNVEVRNRDYFYHPFYQLWGLYLAFGMFYTAKVLTDYIKNKLSSSLAVALFGILAVIYQIYQHYPFNNRTANYIPEDFAHNILVSAKSDKGVFMTNGDNDTFPVWFVQEVLKRKWGLINANLSLLNTNWYIREVKHWGAPITLSDEDIYRLPPIVNARNEAGVLYLRDLAIRDMIAGAVGYKTDKYTEIMGIDGKPIKIPAIYLADNLSFAKEVFEGKEFSIPIYFSLTSDPEVFRGWEDYMVLEGLLLRLTGESRRKVAGFGSVDVEWTDRVITGGAEEPVEFVKTSSLDYKNDPRLDRWSFRSLFDDRVPKNEDHLRLLRNYASAVLTLAAQYISDGNYSRADKLFDLGELFSRKSIEGLGVEPERDPQIFAIRLSRGYIKMRMGQFKEAEEILNKYQRFLPTSEYSWRLALIKLYSGDIDSARDLAKVLINSVPEIDPIWGLSLDTLYTLIPPDSLTDVSYRLFTKGHFDLALKTLERSNTTKSVKTWAGILIRAVKDQDEEMFRSLVSYAPFDTVKAGEWKKELNRLYTSLARYLRQAGDEENAKKMEEYAKGR